MRVVFFRSEWFLEFGQVVFVFRDPSLECIAAHPSRYNCIAAQEVCDVRELFRLCLDLP